MWTVTAVNAVLGNANVNDDDMHTKWHEKERNVTKRDAGSPGNCSGHVKKALEDSSLHRALASVDQLDSAMPLIYQNPLDKYCQNLLRYPVDSDLSNG